MDHHAYVRRYGDDMPDIKDWTWGGQTAAARGATSTGGDNA
jgi:xylulose-5-phosphate/fructose-6-phosphate phosphoketolase